MIRFLYLGILLRDYYPSRKLIFGTFRTNTNRKFLLLTEEYFVIHEEYYASRGGYLWYLVYNYFVLKFVNIKDNRQDVRMPIFTEPIFLQVNPTQKFGTCFDCIEKLRHNSFVLFPLSLFTTDINGNIMHL